MKLVWVEEAVTNSSDPFSKSELQEIQRWALPDISESDRSTAMHVKSVDSRSVRGMTVEDIEEMQQQAFDEAAEQGHKAGYTKGFEEARKKGYDKGYAEAKGDIKNALAKWSQLIESLEHPLNDLDDQVEEELVVLAIAIARHIVDVELTMNSQQVATLVKKAMHLLPANSRRIRLHLHPEDAELIRSGLVSDDVECDWTIIEEPSLMRGGCKIDTQNSRIDATIEKRLAAAISSVYGEGKEEKLEN